MNRLMLHLSSLCALPSELVRRCREFMMKRVPEDLMDWWLLPALEFARFVALFLLGLFIGWAVLVLFAHELGIDALLSAHPFF